MADSHQRNESTDSVDSSASAYQLILDHVLSYPASYEIPLRTMYTLNCAPRAQPLPGRSSPPSSSPASTPDPARSFSGSPMTADGLTTRAFEDNLMAQVAQLPTQPASLPPSFITSFVQRCFPADLTRVDFPHALVALDYLKDLESRRRREVAAAMARLDIDRAALEPAADVLASRRPGVERWVRSMEERERKVESLYTRLYIGLRRWVLVNEMTLQPFSKHNCVAMLNTLYPPIVASQPTSKLTSTVLLEQRKGFFNYISSVEANGTSVLRNLMQQGKGVGEENGWRAVTRIVSMYLQLANSIIADASDVMDERDVAPPRKADSGVSFNGFDSSAKPSDNTPKASENLSSVNDMPAPSASSARHVPAHSAGEMPARPKTPSGASISRPGTTLEKIARGLRTIGRGRTVAATEMLRDFSPSPPSPSPPSPTPTNFDKPRGLRKMRSMGTLETRGATKQISLSPQDHSSAADYDVEHMRRQRLRYEAAAQKFGNPRRQEV